MFVCFFSKKASTILSILGPKQSNSCTGTPTPAGRQDTWTVSVDVVEGNSPPRAEKGRVVSAARREGEARTGEEKQMEKRRQTGKEREH